MGALNYFVPSGAICDYGMSGESRQEPETEHPNLPQWPGGPADTCQRCTYSQLVRGSVDIQQNNPYLGPLEHKSR